MAAKFKRISRAWGQLDIEDDTQTAKINIDRSLVSALQASAPALKSTALTEVPVKTGKLKRSISTLVDADKLTLALTSGGAEARHAHLVEFGTVHAHANPFMRRSIRKNRPGTLVKIKAALGKEQT